MIHTQDADFTLLNCDVLEGLRSLEAESVHCVVTSPPYWGLRDYATIGQLGLEPTPDAYITRMVEVFREVRRVLRADGTLWLNIGDSYAGSGPSGASYQSETTKRRAEQTQDGSFRISKTLGERGLTYAEKKPIPPPGLKAKDLCGIPWRLAFALQADGWYLRADIIWAKPNPMPESVTDRPTKAHEFVFLLTKAPRYFFDQEAVREPAEYGRREWTGVLRSGEENGDGHRSSTGSTVGGNPASGRNVRSVWEIAENTSRPQTQRACQLFIEAGLTEEHLAAIKAVGITDVGKAQYTQDGYGHNTAEQQWLAAEAKDVLGGYYREFLLPAGGRNVKSVWTIATQPYPEAHFATYPEELVRRCILAGSPLGGTVLDPFAGSGTTNYVARKHGRRSIGIELSAEYAELAARRMQQQSLFAEGVA